MSVKISVVTVGCIAALAAVNAASAYAGPGTSVTEEDVMMQQIGADAGEVRRVIVKVRPTAVRSQEGSVGEADIVAHNKAQLAERMQDNGALLIEPIAGSPLLVMEVTPRGMENLLSSPFVVDVQEDRPEMAQ